MIVEKRNDQDRALWVLLVRWMLLVKVCVTCLRLLVKVCVTCLRYHDVRSDPPGISHLCDIYHTPVTHDDGLLSDVGPSLGRLQGREVWVEV